jgi:hypothetical protein
MKLMGKQWELACLAALLLVAGDAIGASSRAGAVGLVAKGPVAASSSPCLSRRRGGEAQLLRLRGGAFWFSATAGEEEFVSAPPSPCRFFCTFLPSCLPHNLDDSCVRDRTPALLGSTWANTPHPPAHPSTLPRAHSAALSLPPSPSLHRRRPSTGRSAQRLQHGSGTSSRSYALSAPRKLQCSRRTPAVCPPPPPLPPLPPPPPPSPSPEKTHSVTIHGDGRRVA